MRTGFIGKAVWPRRSRRAIFTMFWYMKKSDKCLMVGMLDIKKIESVRRVYWWGGVSPAILTNGGRDTNILLYEERDDTETAEERGGEAPQTPAR